MAIRKAQGPRTPSTPQLPLAHPEGPRANSGPIETLSLSRRDYTKYQEKISSDYTKLIHLHFFRSILQVLFLKERQART